MKINTYYHGEVVVNPRQLVQFPEGLPGFSEARKFAILPLDEDSGFDYLQSVEDEHVVFLLVSPFLIEPEFAFDLEEEEKEQLHITEQSELAIFCIVTCGGCAEDFTVNLLAPIVWNQTMGLAKQLILYTTDYHTKHPLVQREEQEFSTKEETANVGTLSQET